QRQPGPPRLWLLRRNRRRRHSRLLGGRWGTGAHQKYHLASCFDGNLTKIRPIKSVGFLRTFILRERDWLKLHTEILLVRLLTTHHVLTGVCHDLPVKLREHRVVVS